MQDQTELKIELKNVKIAQFASRDTTCFEATVYLNGKRAGVVSNDGNGGPHSYRPYELMERLNEYGKTLPKLRYESFEFDADADSLIDESLADFESRKILKRLLKNHLVYTVAGKSGVFQNKVDESFLSRVLPDPVKVKKNKGALGADVLLNLLPLESAVKVLNANGDTSFLPEAERAAA